MGLFITELRYESGEASVGPAPGSESVAGRDYLLKLALRAADLKIPLRPIVKQKNTDSDISYGDT